MPASVDPRHGEAAELLLHIEAEMRRITLWAEEAPTAEALASTQPFCIDTLSLPQWLQFVFIERLKMMIEHNQPLPDSCAIMPMAEAYFTDDPSSVKGLLALLADMDTLLTS